MPVLLLALTLLLTSFGDTLAASAPYSGPIDRGVNLAAAEFGSAFPGVYGKDYTYPTQAEYDYYGAAPSAGGIGQRLIRLPFRWERIQYIDPATNRLAVTNDINSELVAVLQPAELARLDQQLYWASQRSMKIALDMHNYARYTTGSTDYVIDAYNSSASLITADDFQRVWRALAKYFTAGPAFVDPAIGLSVPRSTLYSAIWAYGLMNEPHNMPTATSDATITTWGYIAQQGLLGVRGYNPVTKKLYADGGDNTGQVLIAGDDYSSALNWTKTWGNTNSSKLATMITDPYQTGTTPATNLVNIRFEAHQYFDSDGSGQYRTSSATVDPQLGVQRLQPFLTWLKKYGVKGYIGEFGVPNNQSQWWKTSTGGSGMLVNFYQAMRNNTFADGNTPNPVPSTYWAGGPWWGTTYILSTEPSWGVNGRITSIKPVVKDVISHFPAV